MKYYQAQKLKRVNLRRKRSKKPLWTALIVFGLLSCTFFYFCGPDSNSPLEASIPPLKMNNLEESGASAKSEKNKFKNEVFSERTEVGSTEQKKITSAKAELDNSRVGSKPKISVQEGTIQAGQTITSLLGDYLTPAQIYALADECSEVHSLKRIKTGQAYRIRFADGLLRDFEYEIDDKTKLQVQKDGDNFVVRKKDIVYDIQRILVRAEIENSLFQAATKIGESSALPVRIAQIFAWDVDFVKDIRSGDSFRALIEKRYRKGKFAGYGKILAARFVNKGTEFNAFLFEDSGGRCDYYDQDGNSVRKAFLKAPLEFSRISSGYTHSRMHPILKIRRPHLAIDYAAPRGTPIKAIGDGKIVTRSYAKGAGRYVKVRHNSVYTSVYNHMCRFARGLRVGKRVKQGETIGYVGATGYATGPHLDFRMKKNGKYVNPLKIKSPPVEPVPEKDLPHFKKTVNPLMAALEGEIKVAGKTPKTRVHMN